MRRRKLDPAAADALRISRRALLRGRIAWTEPAVPASVPAPPAAVAQVAGLLGDLAGAAPGMDVLGVGADADAANLPYADGRFDVVTSAFAAAQSADPRAAARELVRVTCPGGVVAVVGWEPDPWADAATARAHFGDLLDGLELRPHAFEDARCLLVRGRRPIPQAVSPT